MGNKKLSGLIPQTMVVLLTSQKQYIIIHVFLMVHEKIMDYGHHLNVSQSFEM